MVRKVKVSRYIAVCVISSFCELVDPVFNVPQMLPKAIVDLAASFSNVYFSASRTFKGSVSSSMPCTCRLLVWLCCRHPFNAVYEASGCACEALMNCEG